MKGGARDWASSDDYTGLSLAVIVVGVALGGWWLWQEYHAGISMGVMTLMHWEMLFIHHLTDRFNVADKQVVAANPARVTFQQLVRLARATGAFFLYPAEALMIGLAWICYRRAASSRFTRNLDLHGLMREQVKTFKSLAAYLRRRLGLAGVRTGMDGPRPADPALNLGEWVECWAIGNKREFSEERVREELIRQLGPPWYGLESAAPYVRCMMAVFGLHGAKRRAEAVAFLGELSQSLANAKGEGEEGPKAPLSFSRSLVAVADQYLLDPDVGQMVLRVMDRHGFTTPGMMSVLMDARGRAGVLSPSQFCFLKLVDRRLWYALHSLGFPADGARISMNPRPVPEAIGARDHWAVECRMGAALFAPSLDGAMETIRAGLRDYVIDSRTGKVRR